MTLEEENKALRDMLVRRLKLEEKLDAANADRDRLIRELDEALKRLKEAKANG